MKKVLISVVLIVLVLTIGLKLYKIGYDIAKKNDNVAVVNNESNKQNIKSEINSEKKELTINEKIELNKLLANIVYCGLEAQESDVESFDNTKMIEVAILSVQLNEEKYKNEIFSSGERSYFLGKNSMDDKIYIPNDTITNIIKEVFNVEGIEYSKELSKQYHQNIKGFEIYKINEENLQIYKSKYLEKINDNNYIIHTDKVSRYIVNNLSEEEKAKIDVPTKLNEPSIIMYDKKLIVGEAKIHVEKITENENDRYIFKKLESVK